MWENESSFWSLLPYTARGEETNNKRERERGREKAFWKGGRDGRPRNLNSTSGLLLQNGNCECVCVQRERERWKRKRRRIGPKTCLWNRKKEKAAQGWVHFLGKENISHIETEVAWKKNTKLFYMFYVKLSDRFRNTVDWCYVPRFIDIQYTVRETTVQYLSKYYYNRATLTYPRQFFIVRWVSTETQKQILFLLQFVHRIHVATRQTFFSHLSPFLNRRCGCGVTAV